MPETEVIEMKDVKAAITALNTAFEAFKAANDTRLKEIAAKGVADPLLQEKLDKLNAEIEKHAAITDAFAKLEAKVNRQALAGGGPVDGDADVKAFNLTIRAHAQAMGRLVPADLSAEEYRAYKQHFGVYLRRGADALFEGDRKAMSVGSDPDGGYLVTPDMSGAFVKRRFNFSPIRQIASVQQTSSDKLEGLADTTDLSGGGWVGETGSRAATGTPTMKNWQIPVHEQYQNPGATQKLLDDASIDVEAWLMAKIADSMARREGTAFTVGTGIGQPRGFASYTTAATADGSRAWGVLEHVGTGSNGSFGTAPNGSDKLIALVGALKPHFRTGARFVMPRLTLAATRTLKDTVGNYIWLPTMQAGQPSSLLGYPITEAEDLVAYTTTGALGIAFGDFAAGYQIVDRIGIRVLRDPFTNKPYIQFYTTARVGGDVIDFEAIKFLKFS